MTTKIDPKDAGTFPAFPVTDQCRVDGLSTRELFAALALQGIVSRRLDDLPSGDGNQTTHEATAEQAVLYADSLIDELTAKTKESTR